MRWERTTRGRLICNPAAYRGVVERTKNDCTRSGRAEASHHVYHVVFDDPSMSEAQT